MRQKKWWSFYDAEDPVLDAEWSAWRLTRDAQKLKYNLNGRTASEALVGGNGLVSWRGKEVSGEPEVGGMKTQK